MHLDSIIVYKSNIYVFRSNFRYKKANQYVDLSYSGWKTAKISRWLTISFSTETKA